MSEASEDKRRQYFDGSDTVTHLIEDRRAPISPWGLGNSKLGPGVYTYSKTAVETCPGATEHCISVCFARRMGAHVDLLHRENTKRGASLPPLPDDARLVRGHVGGDFDTATYILAWCRLATKRPEVQFWFYTRSWRVPQLLPFLEILRELPNVQVWASMDPDCEPAPPGWRRAWMSTDPRGAGDLVGKACYRTEDGIIAPVCPEEAGTKENCVACGYCFRPFGGDLVFVER